MIYCSFDLARGARSFDLAVEPGGKARTTKYQRRWSMTLLTQATFSPQYKYNCSGCESACRAAFLWGPKNSIWSSGRGGACEQRHKYGVQVGKGKRGKKEPHNPTATSVVSAWNESRRTTFCFSCVQCGKKRQNIWLSGEVIWGLKAQNHLRKCQPRSISASTRLRLDTLDPASKHLWLYQLFSDILIPALMTIAKGNFFNFAHGGSAAPQKAQTNQGLPPVYKSTPN